MNHLVDNNTSTNVNLKDPPPNDKNPFAVGGVIVELTNKLLEDRILTEEFYLQIPVSRGRMWTRDGTEFRNSLTTKLVINKTQKTLQGKESEILKTLEDEQFLRFKLYLNLVAKIGGECDNVSGCGWCEDLELMYKDMIITRNLSICVKLKQIEVETIKA